MHDLIRFNYRCRRVGCKNPEFWAYSEDALQIRIDMHERLHKNELDIHSSAIDKVIAKIPDDSRNILKLTWLDVTFLMSRGVRIDEDMEWEGYTKKYVKTTD